MNSNLKILFFTSFKSRSITLESTILYFQKQGGEVHLLTTCEEGDLHSYLKVKGIKVSVFLNRKNNLNQIIELRKYSKHHKIDIVHSHLQQANLIASIAHIGQKWKLLTVRHNTDVIYLSGTKKERLAEKIINRLSPLIIAISEKVKSQLLKEGVKENKIVRINNGYDFKEYDNLSDGKNTYQEIKNKYQADLLFVSPGRLIKSKRHDILISAIKKLIDKNYNVKLLILGEGPDYRDLKELIAKSKITNSVFLLGHKNNIIDYILAGDIIVLFSESEASSNVIKEAGYYTKIVVACSDVGDFDEYIINEKNGFLISKQSPKQNFIYIVEKILNKQIPIDSFGVNLKCEIIQNFSISEIGMKYDELHREMGINM